MNSHKRARLYQHEKQLAENYIMSSDFHWNYIREKLLSPQTIIIAIISEFIFICISYASFRNWNDFIYLYL